MIFNDEKKNLQIVPNGPDSMWPPSTYAVESDVAFPRCVAQRGFRGFRIWGMTCPFSGRGPVRGPSTESHRVSPSFALIFATPVQSRPSVVFELTGGRSHCSRPPASRQLRAGGAFFSLTSRACAVESQTWAADGIRAGLRRWIVTCSPVLCAL